MKRPKIRIQADRFDYLLEALTLIGLIGLLIITAINYGSLPESIPKHFDWQGNPDSYGSKNTIWFLPILGILLYFGLTILSRYPHTFNYSVQVTNDNAERIYKKGIITIRIIKLMIVSTFVYFNLKMISIASGQLEKLSSLFLLVILVLFIVIPVITYIWLRR